MINNLSILAINHISDVEDECCRVAISPSHVKFIASRDIRKNDRDLKHITVTFMDGDAQSFCIGGLELILLEEVCAGYSFD